MTTAVSAIGRTPTRGHTVSDATAQRRKDLPEAVDLLLDDDYEVIELDSFAPTSFATPVAYTPGQPVAFRLYVPLQHPHVGATGQIYRCYDANGMELAAKCFVPKEADDRDSGLSSPDAVPSTQQQVAAFRAEYETHLRVSNLKGFPRVYGYGMAAGSPVIVMEWVHGADLRYARVSLPQGQTPRSVDAKVVAGIGAEVFRILERLQILSGELTHRDLSMGNVMLRTSKRSIAEQCETGEYDVCLIDFGAAAFATDDDDGSDGDSAGWHCGTPAYASPEMLAPKDEADEAARRSPAVDVYAACSVLYHLACGHVPYFVPVDATPEDRWRQKLTEPPAPLDLGEKNRELADVVTSGIVADPAARPSASELRKRLEAIAASDSSQGTHGSSPNRKRMLTRAGAVIGVIALVAFLVALPVALWRHHHATAVNGQGTTSGNALNGGLAQDQGGWDYRVQIDDAGTVQIVRCEDDGTVAGGTPEVLYASDASLDDGLDVSTLAGLPHGINVSDDDLYFCEASEDGARIMRMGTDGDDLAAVAELPFDDGSTGGIDCLTYADGWLYCILWQDDAQARRTTRLVALPADGTGEAQVVDEATSLFQEPSDDAASQGEIDLLCCLNVQDDTLFYLRAAGTSGSYVPWEGYTICKVQLDEDGVAGDPQEVCTGDTLAGCMLVDGETIYVVEEAYELEEGLPEDDMPPEGAYSYEFSWSLVAYDLEGSPLPIGWDEPFYAGNLWFDGSDAIYDHAGTALLNRQGQKICCYVDEGEYFGSSGVALMEFDEESGSWDALLPFVGCRPYSVCTVDDTLVILGSDDEGNLLLYQSNLDGTDVAVLGQTSLGEAGLS